MKHKFLTIFSVLIIAGLTTALAADPPPNYYNSTTGLSGNALLNALESIIDNHNNYGYNTAKEHLWENVDHAGGGNVYLIYLGGTRFAPTRDTNGTNAEHTWPQSRGADASVPRTDMHHLIVSDSTMNSRRGNLPYDNVSNPDYEENGNKIDNGRAFEPRDAVKGDIARAQFYMAVRYSADNGFSLVNGTNPSGNQMGSLSTMLEWHLADPPDAREHERHERIYALQGNRNPFIDDPGFAPRIWGGATPSPSATPTPSLTPTPSPTGPTPTPSPSPTPSPTPGPGGLIFSEYVEGSSNNKALEIWNAGNTAVSLNNVVVELYRNGDGSSPQTLVELSGTLNPGEVVVAAHSDLSHLADFEFSGSPYNGDDALVLTNGSTIYDSFGRRGEDPGSAWEGNGVSSQNQTLRRKSGIVDGDTNPDDVFDPSVEWDMFPQDDFTDLGDPPVGATPTPSPSPSPSPTPSPTPSPSPSPTMSPTPSPTPSPSPTGTPGPTPTPTPSPTPSPTGTPGVHGDAWIIRM